MWVLWDEETKTQWFLYGEGWEGARARARAEQRINGILATVPDKAV